LLRPWIIEALVELGGSGKMIDVAKIIWNRYSTDLMEAGDLFFRWQYVLRWAATTLRHDGVLLQADQCERGVWTLAITAE